MTVWVAAALLFSAVQLSSPAPQPPPPPGNRIVAQDGDTVVVDHHARVRIVRSTQANVRAVFNAAEHWVMVLADFTEDGGPDGRVDSTRSYYGVIGDWPLEPRWEGMATLEEYVGVGPGTGAPGFGLRTPQGLVQFLSPSPQPSMFREPDALAVISARGSSGAIAGDASFDDAERRLRADVRRNSGPEPFGSPMPPGVAVSGSAPGGVPPASVASLAMNPGALAGALRVGGHIAPPAKVHDVPPIAPAAAQRAGIRGVVIVEVTIDVDGTVSNARVLRSIPLLDPAAVEAVRQWRYSPTLLNGQAVPVVMTVTVPFP